MPRFFWQGADQLAHNADLRRLGWRLEGVVAAIADLPDFPAGPGLVLVDGHHRASLGWRDPACTSVRLREQRRWVLMIGICDGCERATLLESGIGDVVGDDASLDEIAARARRVCAIATMLPRARRHGGLRLELLARDGYVRGKRVGLHPREFALAWRLMEEPGRPVDKATLLRDVWRLEHVPETNSLAVHARRLRTKLELAGLPGFIRTADSGYALVADPSETAEAPSSRAFLLEPRPGDHPGDNSTEEVVPPAIWRN